MADRTDGKERAELTQDTKHRTSGSKTAPRKPAARKPSSAGAAGKTTRRRQTAAPTPKVTARQAAIQRETANRVSKQGHRRTKKPNHTPQIAAVCAVLVLIGVTIYAMAAHGRQPAEPTVPESVPASEHAQPQEPTAEEETVDRSQVVVGSDVLAAESTPNSGGYNRTINLDLACKAIDGTLLLPDEVFSFNEVVGERTEGKGYLPASIYTSGTVSDEIGGGICQVASTLYLAAMKADFDILERSAHQFTVSYMPLGSDASIYWGSQDLRFRNTSDAPVYIYASTDGYTVDISIVGTKADDGYIEIEYEIIATYEPEEREVVDWMEEPGYSEVTDTPITGYYVQSYRCYYSADGTLLHREKESISNYNKRDKITMVGPPETEPPTEPETESETELEEQPPEPWVDPDTETGEPDIGG